MKLKFKLLLATLPIVASSTILIACNKEQKPANSNSQPIDQNKPEKPTNPSDSKDPQESKDPSGVSEPEKPTNPPEPEKPSEPSEPKPDPEPEQPIEKPEQPKEVSFASLDNFPTEFSTILDKDQDAETVFNRYKSSPNSFINLINIAQEYKEEYTIKSVVDNQTKATKTEGYIENIILEFTKQNQTQQKIIKIKDFKIPELTEREKKIKEASEFFSKKELSENFKKLYPSFLATMSLYAYNPENFASRKTSTTNSERQINLENLVNNTRDFFRSSLSFSKENLKNEFFEWDENSDKYEIKIKGADADDINGTLKLSTEIIDTQDHSGTSNLVEKEFVFEGLKSWQNKLENPKDSIITFFMTPADAKEATKSLKSRIDAEIQKISADQGEVEITDKLVISDYLKTAIFNRLLISIIDNGGIYKNSYGSPKAPNFVALDNRIAVFPFVTNLTKEIIDQIKVFVDKRNDGSNRPKVTFKLNLVLQLVQEDYPSTMQDVSWASDELNLKSEIYYFISDEQQ
ncbi:LppA-related lipoprotein [Mycoplasma procyoni]|uniref:LppA-related lipoprotein n=1 Tax=Mycoplasma procyoni TaxID=568784 RepID=UPI00197BAFB8|nr:hypothetical protein [Mycoplasma procyoni]MBN3534853.1 hypothetical protein [Mycoplasma procyoni]